MKVKRQKKGNLWCTIIIFVSISEHVNTISPPPKKIRSPANFRSNILAHGLVKKRFLTLLEYENENRCILKQDLFGSQTFLSV